MYLAFYIRCFIKNNVKYIYFLNEKRNNMCWTGQTTIQTMQENSLCHFILKGTVFYVLTVISIVSPWGKIPWFWRNTKKQGKYSHYTKRKYIFKLRNFKRHQHVRNIYILHDGFLWKEKLDRTSEDCCTRWNNTAKIIHFCVNTNKVK